MACTFKFPGAGAEVTTMVRLRRWPVVLIALIGVLGGLGFASQSHNTVKFAAGALAVIFGGALAAIAARRFSLLLVLLFAVRPLLDSLKDGQQSATFTPGSAVELVFLFAALLWLEARRTQGRLARPGVTSVAMIAFTVACALSVPASHSYAISAEGTLKVASGLVMFLVLEQMTLDDPRSIRPLYVATCWVTVAVSIIADVEGVLRTSADGRVRGVFTHENAAAEYTVTVLLLLIAVWPRLSGRLQLLTTAAIVTSLPALYVTYARGAWLGFVLGLLVIGMLQDRRLIAGVVVSLMAVVVLVPGITARFSDLKDKRVVGEGDPNSFAFRERYWHQIAGFANHTPVDGIGLDMIEHSTPEMLLPHNTPLEIWLETGAAGSITFLWVCAGLALSLRRAVRGLPRGTSRSWAVGAAAATAAFGLQMLTDNLLLQAIQFWYLALSVAPAMALVRVAGSGRSTDLLAARPGPRPRSAGLLDAPELIAA
jgi:hypothetical protein